MSTEPEFAWTDESLVLFRRQPATAVYTNPFDAIVEELIVTAVTASVTESVTSVMEAIGIDGELPLEFPIASPSGVS